VGLSDDLPRRSVHRDLLRLEVLLPLGAGLSISSDEEAAPQMMLLAVAVVIVHTDPLKVLGFLCTSGAFPPINSTSPGTAIIICQTKRTAATVGY